MSEPDDSRVVCGDALTLLKNTPSGSVHAVITDPPYNVNYKYNSYKDALSWDEYLRWQLDIIRECERILTPDGSLFYLNYPEFNSSMWVAMQEMKLKPVELIAWVYNTHTGGSPLRKSFRTWIWASKGDPVNEFYGEYKNPNDKRVARLIADGRRPREYDWWNIEQVKNVNREKTEHPCQLPELMIRKIILGCTRPGDVVLDPFLGSGTTAVAAKQCGRVGVGFERDLEYATIASRRLAVARTVDEQQRLAV